ncbi:MAG: hypothetical protein ABJN26_19750 [Stappiaceae bacterium]
MELLLPAFVLMLFVYAFPVALPLGRFLFIVWSLLGLVVLVCWVLSIYGYFATQGARGLMNAIDMFFVLFLSVSWLLAGILQGIRRWAHQNDKVTPPHWLLAVLGGLLTLPITLVAFMATPA